MDWDDLRGFLALARAGRVSTAARGLAVEHTTVSRRIAALERDLGVRLFYRTASGYRLTAEGQMALGEAAAIEQSALVLAARARERAGSATGRVRVAMVGELASEWLAPLVPAFRKLHPGIELEILVGIDVVDLTRGEADLAIRIPRPRQPGLAAVKLASLATGLYATRAVLGRRRRVDEASRGLPLLVYSAAYHALQSAAWFQPVMAGSTTVLMTNHSQVLLRAALAGSGIAVLPRFMADAHRTLVSVSEDLSANDMWLVTHAEVRRDPKVRLTAEFLRRAAAALR
jgi:DNA-binding transcriptional LysR family regulator